MDAVLGPQSGWPSGLDGAAAVALVARAPHPAPRVRLSRLEARGVTLTRRSSLGGFEVCFQRGSRDTETLSALVFARLLFLPTFLSEDRGRSARASSRCPLRVENARFSLMPTKTKTTGRNVCLFRLLQKNGQIMPFFSVLSIMLFLL